MSYPASMMQRARQHHAGHWNIREIGELLEEEFGRRPSHTTIRYWVNPKMKARDEAVKNAQRARQRAERNGGRILSAALTRANHRVTEDFKVSRMRALSSLGLRPATVAKVVSFDFDEPISRYKVVKALEGSSA